MHYYTSDGFNKRVIRDKNKQSFLPKCTLEHKRMRGQILHSAVVVETVDPNMKSIDHVIVSQEYSLTIASYVWAPAGRLPAYHVLVAV